MQTSEMTVKLKGNSYVNGFSNVWHLIMHVDEWARSLYVWFAATSPNDNVKGI